MKNYDIRCSIQQHRLHHYEIADALGINESTFSRWLRDELPEDKKEKIFQIIEQIANQ